MTVWQSLSGEEATTIWQTIWSLLFRKSAMKANTAGCAWGGRHNFSAALKCFERAVHLDPFYSDAWYNKALCHKNTKHYDKAVFCFRNALEIKPNDLKIKSQLLQTERLIEKEKEREEQERVQAEATRLEAERKLEYRRQADILNQEESKRIKTLLLSNIDHLLALSSNGFEDAIADLFRALGYTVEQTPYVNDGGKDAIATKDGKRYLIECKRWATDSCVGRPDIMKFYAAMQDEKAIKGFFVTTSRFSLPASEYAKKNNIELVDGPALSVLLKKTYEEHETVNTVRQMCIECGNLCTFNLDEVVTKKLCHVCRSVVANCIFPSGEVTLKHYHEPPKPAYPRQSRKRRYRRYHR